jgi:hypothetical protein
MQMEMFKKRRVTDTITDKHIDLMLSVLAENELARAVMLGKTHKMKKREVLLKMAEKINAEFKYTDDKKWLIENAWARWRFLYNSYITAKNMKSPKHEEQLCPHVHKIDKALDYPFGNGVSGDIIKEPPLEEFDQDDDDDDDEDDVIYLKRKEPVVEQPFIIEAPNPKKRPFEEKVEEKQEEEQKAANEAEKRQTDTKGLRLEIIRARTRSHLALANMGLRSKEIDDELKLQFGF